MNTVINIKRNAVDAFRAKGFVRIDEFTIQWGFDNEVLSIYNNFPIKVYREVIGMDNREVIGSFDKIHDAVNFLDRYVDWEE